jgi:pyruvate,water dikinase
MRRQVPRLLLSDGRAFYEGITSTNHAANMLNGSPVSPGSVEGLVRVVLNPRQANLRPGEILVCPGTDPSWTPLFLSAGGLVMEVGGMMTHGAVVAREYGIPAIVGVDQATRRLHTGQKIRIDGSTGLIQLLDMEEVI